MTSFQSELGEGGGIAEELAESQRAISIAEFFEKNKHMLGFDSGARGLVTAVKEAVDNALDATEEAGIFPDIYVEIRESDDYYRLVVEDNGPGITREQIPKIFGKLLYGSRFHAREQSLLPDQPVLIRRDGRVELTEIGTLCDAYMEADGERTVPVGADVQAPCFDRDDGTVEWHDVTHLIRHETDGDAYRVETTRGRSIEVTGDHSLFTVEDGEIAEVPARELNPGDHVVAPETIPAPEDVRSVNLLERVPNGQLADRDWYVYGIDTELIEEIRDRGRKVRKPASEGGRDRTYYRLDGVDVLKDSLEANYLDEGYLPADVVAKLGWERRVSEGRIRTYQVGGTPDEVPVTVELTEDIMRFLGLYVSEGHADVRQAGFTFGSHEEQLIEEVRSTAREAFAASTTVEHRERNSTRVKTFGSPLTTFLEAVCGDGARNKRIPGFVFRAPADLQRAFVDALIDGDGSDAHPANELEYTTTSERLARELSYLLSMRGVVASWEERTNDNDVSGDSSRLYSVKVYGEDVSAFGKYTADADRTARYRRLPPSLVGDLAVEECERESVPATMAGVFLAAGLGSDRTYAKRFVRRAEHALEGSVPHDDYYRRTLEESGFLTEDGTPTGKLERLWERGRKLVAFGESDLCLLRVTDVTEVDPPEYVYDISVPGTGADENFVAGPRGALCAKNSRGQQGIGISAAVLYAQLTSGKPAKITSRTDGDDRAQYFELIIDTDENEPEIKNERELAPGESDLANRHGTRIEMEMEANMRARQQLHDYVKHTAVVNPHARIELQEPGLDEPMKFERAENAELPAETEEIRPHPHGVELGTVLKMLEETASHSVSGFLQEEFTRVGKKTADSIIDAFRDRHYGRGMGWTPPRKHEDADLEVAVRAATANKGQRATRSFARRVADGVEDRQRVAHHELRAVVANAAEAVEAEFDTRFGDTVRDNAVEAAWRTLTGDDTDADDRRGSDLYRVVDDATTKRKDDAAVRRVADRLATRVRTETDRDRFTRETLAEYVDWAADGAEEREDVTFGETARENVVEAVWERASTVPDDPPKVRQLTDDRGAAADLVEAMRATDIMAPPTGCLSPITAELVEAGLRKEYDADFYAAATRDADVTGGDPFIVEAGIAYGGDLEDGTAEVLRFANRVPLVYQRGACATTDVVKSIGWRNYKLDQPGGSGLPKGPAVIMVHVASTNVPFTSESKDAVANVPEIESEIELAVREAARELKSYLKEKRSLKKRRRKQDVIASILPEMSRKVAEVTGEDPPDYGDALARIMNNVLVERRTSDEGDRTRVELAVENHTDRNESLEVTEMVTTEPHDLTDGATAVEMGDEWAIKWEPDVDSGDEAVLEYDTDGEFVYDDPEVDGVPDEKVTVDGGENA